jgi:RNA polymerase sigma factor (TIGR02999 family)
MLSRPNLTTAATYHRYDATYASPDELATFAHQELRAAAHARLVARQRGEPVAPLTTSALVHHAYLELVDQAPSKWRDRSSFSAIAAVAMRRLLVECAEARLTRYAASGNSRLTLDHEAIAPEEQAAALLQLDAAFTRLVEVDHRLANIGECRFFGGLTHDEISVALGVSAGTVRRGWSKARAMLRYALEVGDVPDDVVTRDRGIEWSQLSSLIDALLDLPADERPMLITQLSEDDMEQRDELHRILADCEHEPALFASPAVERFAALLDEDVSPFPAVLASRYESIRELGSGRAATVYLARDRAVARDVALKVVHPEVAASLGSVRFLDEVYAASQLDHPHLVRVLDAGVASGVPYYAMPFVSGPSLQERMASGKAMAIEQVISVMRDVCEALAYVHQHGIVHQDLKPANVFLSGDGALVADTGLTSALSGTERSSASVVGTPAYMAPEQIVGEPSVDQRTDLYSAGVLAYEMLTGRRPLNGETRRELLAAQMTETVPHVERLRADVPDWLSDIVMQCLEKRPADRWASADAVVTAIDMRGAATARARRTRITMAAIVLVIAAAVSSLAVWRLVIR